MLLARLLIQHPRSQQEWTFSIPSESEYDETPVPILRWDCSALLDDGSPLYICTTPIVDGADQLASFVPPPIDMPPSSAPPASLTVFPDGHAWMDEVILSILILERLRGLDQS